MKKITNTADLELAIAELKQQRIDTEMEMVYQAKAFGDEIKDNLVNASIGVGTGIIAKKILPISNHGLLNKVAGLSVQGIVTKAVINNADTIKAVSTAIWKNIFKRKKSI